MSEIVIRSFACIGVAVVAVCVGLWLGFRLRRREPDRIGYREWGDLE